MPRVSRSRRPRLICAALALAAGACAPLPPAAPPDSRAAPPPTSTLEREIHSLVNQHRTRARLAPLQLDDALSAIARDHSRAMAERRRPFGHDGFDARADAAGRVVVALRAFAENVAYDSRTGAALAPSVASGWIASPTHRENIEGAFQLTGIGAATGRGGTTYFTQIFAGR